MKFKIFLFVSQLLCPHTFSVQMIQHMPVCTKTGTMGRYAQTSPTWDDVDCIQFRRASRLPTSVVWRRKMAPNWPNGISTMPMWSRWPHPVWRVIIQLVITVVSISSWHRNGRPECEKKNRMHRNCCHGCHPKSNHAIIFAAATIATSNRRHIEMSHESTVNWNWQHDSLHWPVLETRRKTSGFTRWIWRLWIRCDWVICCRRRRMKWRVRTIRWVCREAINISRVMAKETDNISLTWMMIDAAIREVMDATMADRSDRVCRSLNKVSLFESNSVST